MTVAAELAQDPLNSQSKIETSPSPELEKRKLILYRYVDTTVVSKLLEEGSYSMDYASAYATAISERYNPNHLEPEKILTYFVLRGIADSFHNAGPVSTVVKLYRQALVQNDFSRITPSVGEQLAKVDQRLAHIEAVITTAVTQQSTEPIVQFFHAFGGDEILMQLKTAGSYLYPYQCLTNLLSFSVAAPLGVPDAEGVVILELACTTSQILVPVTDTNNEHEVMMREIKMSDVQSMYDQKSFPLLWKKLEERFPNHFGGKSYEALVDFAREVPLTDLIHNNIA